MKNIEIFRKEDEKLLVTIFLIIGTLGFLISFSYSYEPAFFPRLTSGIVLIGAVLLLLKDYLPEPLHSIVSKDERLISGESKVDESVEDSKTEEILGTKEGKTDDHIYVALMFFSFIIIGRLIGLLLASPLFIVVYGWWTNQPYRVIAVMAAIGLILPYLFMEFINLPVLDGILIEVLF